MVETGKEQGVLKKRRDVVPMVSQDALKGVGFNSTHKATKEDSCCNI